MQIRFLIILLFACSCCVAANDLEDGLVEVTAKAMRAALNLDEMMKTLILSLLY